MKYRVSIISAPYICTDVFADDVSDAIQSACFNHLGIRQAVEHNEDSVQVTPVYPGWRVSVEGCPDISEDVYACDEHEAIRAAAEANAQLAQVAFLRECDIVVEAL